MIIKKSGKLIFGAEFTAAEKRALNMEIHRQLAEYDKKHTREIDAIILWTLHEKFGWGEVRLKRFYDEFSKEFENLLGRYEVDVSDGVWLCTKRLKELGIDLEEWEKDS